MPDAENDLLASLVGTRVPVLEWAHAPVPADSGVVVPGLDGAADSVDAAVLVLTLHRVGALDDAFAQLRSMLRPAGTLVVVTPSVAVRTVTDLRWRSVLRAAHRGPWLHRSALDDMGWLLTAADFAVLGDDRLPYALPLPDAAAAHRAVDLLPAAGLWPDIDAGDRARLADALARRAGPGRRLPVPLRRLVARR